MPRIVNRCPLPTMSVSPTRQFGTAVTKTAGSTGWPSRDASRYLNTVASPPTARVEHAHDACVTAAERLERNRRPDIPLTARGLETWLLEQGLARTQQLARPAPYRHRSRTSSPARS